MLGGFNEIKHLRITKYCVKNKSSVEELFGFDSYLGDVISSTNFT